MARPAGWTGATWSWHRRCVLQDRPCRGVCSHPQQLRRRSAEDLCLHICQQVQQLQDAVMHSEGDRLHSHPQGGQVGLQLLLQQLGLAGNIQLQDLLCCR